MQHTKNHLFYAWIILIGIAGISRGKTLPNPQQSPFLLQNDQIRVASFNIRVGRFSGGSKTWSNRRDMVISTLADSKYDVVGLQEALDFQLKEIQRGLPQFKSYAVGRGDEADEGEACAILYRKDRFLMIDSGTLWFSKHPDRPGSKFFGTLFPRICSWVRLVDVDTAKCFYVYNLHLDSNSQRAREKSVRILARHIANRKHTDPFVVMGDFNMELQNPAMMYLQKFDYKSPYDRLQDTWAALYPYRLDEGTYHKFHGKTDGPKIDHILVGEDCEIVKARIDRNNVNGHYPSDHFPISATLDLWPDKNSLAGRGIVKEPKAAASGRQTAGG